VRPAVETGECNVMKLASYWLDTARRFRGGAEGPLPSEADVAVIGGGFSGLSAAQALARKGADVVVLEAETVGGQARPQRRPLQQRAGA
jgi:NADPH-dependent 2,4-dienoyl-CoA reductase/sulfur reductase-like enzyme